MISMSNSLLLISCFLSFQVNENWLENKFEVLGYTCYKVLLIHTSLNFNSDVEKCYDVKALIFISFWFLPPPPPLFFLADKSPSFFSTTVADLFLFNIFSHTFSCLFQCILYGLPFLNWWSTSPSYYACIQDTQFADMHQCHKKKYQLVKYAWGEKKGVIQVFHHSLFWSFQMCVFC